MIIYGTKSITLKSEILNSLECPNCKTKGSLVITVYRKHTHIFWVPIFPLRKRVISECKSCSQVLEEKEMPDKLKKECDNVKLVTKGPIWQLSGLVILLMLFTWLEYSSRQDKDCQHNIT